MNGLGDVPEHQALSHDLLMNDISFGENGPEKAGTEWCSGSPYANISQIAYKAAVFVSNFVASILLQSHSNFDRQAR